jgi:glycosyl transferase family 25
MGHKQSKQKIKSVNMSDSQKWTEKIDAFIFINLEKRPDRRREVLQELQKLGVPDNKIFRINAVQGSDACPAYSACTKSHLLAVKLAIDKSFNRVCILEDDFILHISPTEFNRSVGRAFTILGKNFDLLYLSMTPHVIKVHPKMSNLHKITSSLGTGAMIMNKSFLKKMKSIYEEALKKDIYVDVMIQKHQPAHKMFGFYPPISRQRPGFSDIENKHVDYEKLEMGSKMMRQQKN